MIGLSDASPGLAPALALDFYESAADPSTVTYHCNPTVLLRAIPRIVSGRLYGANGEKSQSHRTAQGNSETNVDVRTPSRRPSRNPTVPLRAIPRRRTAMRAAWWMSSRIPPYCSGQFRALGPRFLPLDPQGRSQSHRTAQGNSERPATSRSRSCSTTSQSHRTAQGNSEADEKG
jgi:hypothetical protein